ncbi:uncharacterized protein BX663DRAFT_265345 [Cokeromyces recurvatus]|uniref:uncharacterized protein n=1 Tax=Cokeromyces recurvatus TaxID=90255 RepID=UPI00222006E3|nr:uncharacterized protein BX663DRAFT_265345 [Cokeromyces recurvatus]KAI7898202.1 hypothetical protein BX663DRAFT_265345 [Cokeromyces recurvatus]
MSITTCFLFSFFIFFIPGHLYILGSKEEVWKQYFSSEEMVELPSYKNNVLIEQLPIELNEMLQKLNAATIYSDSQYRRNVLQFSL